ncbi:MAG: lipoyl synthase [Alistipes sp.]|jgi:lipoic acid synthetase|nr:lipoyl synthase [Alistipes sp.]
MPQVYDKVNVDIKPDWLKTNLHLKSDKTYAKVAQIVERHGVHTICESGRCPNRVECWNRRTATFMVMGDVCTRACKFCATATGKPLPLDASEPQRVARSVGLMGLRHAVVTSVTRDDLSDGGAAHWAEVIRAVRETNPTATVEVLIPDFGGDEALIDTVLEVGPHIVAHNLETVERLTPAVRSRASYAVSIKVLRHISSRCFVAKSGLMVGLGETPDEIFRAFDDLRAAGVAIVTLGQYLRPTLRHLPVAEYVTPEMFEFYKQEALARGFSHVASGPLVRSSYKAHEGANRMGILNALDEAVD